MVEEEKKEENEGEEERGLAKRRRGDWFFGPFGEMDEMFEELDKTFDRFFGRPMISKRRGRPSFRAPACDIQDRGDMYLCEAELPGIDKDDIEIELRDDKLTIKAETKEETKEEGEDYLRHERGYRSFYRELPLPDEVLTEEAEASLSNGVLEITLPKKEPEEKKEGKKIEIK